MTTSTKAKPNKPDEHRVTAKEEIASIQRRSLEVLILDYGDASIIL